jgi:hypothetical protein
VKGDLTNNGEFEGDGYVVFDGSVPQQIIGDGTDAGSFSNIRLDNALGLTVTDDIEVTDVVDLDTGSITVEAGDFITFKSNATKTAIVANTNGGEIDGCVIVERYVPAERAFRFFSSPVTTNDPSGCNVIPSINGNLQEGEQVTDNANYPTASGNAIQGFGTHITGSQFTAPVTSGLDATNTGNPSMFLYNNATGNYTAVLNTRDNGLSAGQDFLLMVRGDRTMNLNIDNTQTGPDTTLRFRGDLVSNNFSINDLNTTASAAENIVYNAVGNPYHSNVDLGQLLLLNSTDILATRAHVYDPHAAGDFGAWITLTYDGSGNLTSATPTTLGKGGNHNGYLQADQAFFVENIISASPISPSINFSEALKSNSTDEGIEIFSDIPSSGLTISIDLYETTENDLRDGILVEMSNQYSDAYEQVEESLKFFNYMESLSISNHNAYYSIEKRNLEDNQNEIVQLSLFNYEDTDYVFKLYINNPENKTVYLVDNYLGTQTLLDMPYYEHSFTVDQSVPASVDPNRFQLNFENTTFSNADFQLSGIEVYPNPVDEVVNIDLSQFTGEVNGLKIFNITGKKVYEKSVSSGHSILDINMGQLADGVYVLQIDTNQGQYQQKLIKN